jgi:hypothetical protein
MSTVDGDTKNFLVHDVGISEGTVDDAMTIVGWAAAIYSGYWYVAAAYAFIDKFLASSGSSSEKPVEAKLKEILANQDADKLGEIINDLNSNAAAIDNALIATRAYGHYPSAETREIARVNLTDPNGLNAALLSLLEGKVYRFMPEVYASEDWATSAWTHGLFRYGTFYHHYAVSSFSGQSYNSSLTTLVLQLYQQHNVPLDPEWALPAPLQKSHDRWDALLCLPLVLNGLPVWEATLSALEPFYRTSGVWTEQIDGMSQKMLEFSAKWLSSTVWIREMPSASELEADNVFLAPLPEQQWPGLPSKKAAAGFHSWPCGVVDPIMGIEIINPTWWKSDNGQQPEMWTADQAEEFKKQRLLQQVKLQDKNGFGAFLKILAGVSKLRIPPSVSPSLKVHSKLIKVGHPSSGDPSAMVAPKYETVIDPGGTAWTAQVKRLSVIVTAPISVQPNPAPAEPHARRALSDTVFGYEITVTPTGGSPHKFTDWVWPLRISDASPSLYHKANGDRRNVPYSIVHKVIDHAKTWETITDGQFRDRRAEGEGDIAFTVTTTVADQEPPRIPEDEFELSGTAWNLHGAIWVKIEADNKANQGRSFEATVEVKETAAVDAKGYPKTHPKFSGKFKTYTQKMTMPVDICRVIVPTNYFGWLARLLDHLHVTSKGFGIPIPQPDPDPALELSLWHSVLEKNPALLQQHVHDLRGMTGRSTLTPREALAEINAAAMKVTMQPNGALTPAMESDLEVGLRTSAELPGRTAVIESETLRQTSREPETFRP